MSKQTIETLEITLNSFIDTLDKYKLSEEHLCLLLGNILIHYSKGTINQIDKVRFDHDVLVDKIDDYTQLESQLVYHPDIRSYILASLGHQMIALSNALLLDKDIIYGRNQSD